MAMRIGQKTTSVPVLSVLDGGIPNEYSNTEEPEVLEANMDGCPLRQFDKWYKNYVERRVDERVVGDPNAVCLSTVGSDGKPSSRMVLLKLYGESGFTFFTHSISRKGREIAENPRVAMLFYWPVVCRQVRIEGCIEAEDSWLADRYWSMRPVASRIGSKISQQSATISSREVLTKAREEMEALAANKGASAITRPEAWIAYTLKPDYYEFWQGQPSRIHDRIVYRNCGGEWKISRLAP